MIFVSIEDKSCPLSQYVLCNHCCVFVTILQVVFACALVCALAKPDYVVSPHGFSYSSASIHPYAYAPYTYAAYAATPYVAAAPSAVAVAPVNVATSYHAQDVVGQASYGHADAFQAHHAVQVCSSCFLSQLNLHS